jgi:hypothetical protein
VHYLSVLLMVAVHRVAPLLTLHPVYLLAAIPFRICEQMQPTGLHQQTLHGVLGCPCSGFGILAEKPRDVEQQLTYLGNKLKQAGGIQCTAAAAAAAAALHV